MAKLFFRYGAMGSSKTANALMVCYNYEERGQKALLAKSAIDTRDGANIVHSRIGLERECILLVRSIYRANKCKDKVLYLEQFLDSFEVVKLEIRLCKDLKLISVKQQAELALLTENIGKQITGWRNAQEKIVNNRAMPDK